jgi:hypothetical protein
MPPPTPPADDTAQPAPAATPTGTPATAPARRSTRAPSTNSASSIVRLMYAYVTAESLIKPLMFLTAVSVLIPVRSRVLLAWRGRTIPWPKISKYLLMASLAAWITGRVSWVWATISMWTSGPAERRRELEEARRELEEATRERDRLIAEHAVRQRERERDNTGEGNIADGREPTVDG